ncbi:hypothetical protein FB451DRAFT_1272253 [Mycena latifolia]|nr:hypothetical protein FB451DRAFT_1272253 [Mycena latifolia]
MPYLFVPQNQGWRDEPNQPWEGNGEDYTDGLSPRMERLLLPFPESPLRHKNPEAAEPLPEEENPLIENRAQSPEPRQSRDTYIHRLTSRQVLLENTYRFDKHSKTHYQYTRFWIFPSDQIADEFHMSPKFIRREWKVDSDVPRPKWIDHEKSPAGSISSYSVHALESEIRKCQYWYVENPFNQDVSQKLWEWAVAVTPTIVFFNFGSDPLALWQAETPERRAPVPRSTRRRAERIHHNVY